MVILNHFEHLSVQAIFPSNKDTLFQASGLYDILKNTDNQQIRTLLSHNSEQFADMSRIVK